MTIVVIFIVLVGGSLFLGKLIGNLLFPKPNAFIFLKYIAIKKTLQ